MQVFHGEDRIDPIQEVGVVVFNFFFNGLEVEITGAARHQDLIAPAHLFRQCQVAGRQSQRQVLADGFGGAGAAGRSQSSISTSSAPIAVRKARVDRSYSRAEPSREQPGW